MINIMMSDTKGKRKKRRVKTKKKVAAKTKARPKPVEVVKTVVKKCKRCTDSGVYKESETICRTCKSWKLYIIS